jgi:hypothetical protein
MVNVPSVPHSLSRIPSSVPHSFCDLNRTYHMLAPCKTFHLDARSTASAYWFTDQAQPAVVEKGGLPTDRRSMCF